MEEEIKKTKKKESFLKRIFKKKPKKKLEENKKVETKEGKKSKQKDEMKKRKPRKRSKFKKKLSQVLTKKIIIIVSIVSILIGIVVFIMTKGIIASLTTTILLFFLLLIYAYARLAFQESTKKKKMEQAFPDFLQLMASNLRAGITTDKALLLSARKEFDPLDKEIIAVGKELITGKRIEEALSDMSKRIKSDNIEKTISLIISGLQSGGNIAILLERTASNMREKAYVEKRAASNVLMYVIFIFFATGLGAPALFGLSSILVEILGNLLSTVPSTTATGTLPFTLTQVSVSPLFITTFSLIFLITTNILGSLVIGLVSKGDEKEGLKYIIPLVSLGIFIFFLMRIVLINYFSGLFG